VHDSYTNNKPKMNIFSHSNIIHEKETKITLQIHYDVDGTKYHNVDVQLKSSKKIVSRSFFLILL